ncbi:MAG: uroporphyrinogen-III synthase, partial [Oricola sp.]
ATVLSAGGAVDDLVALVASREKPGSSFVYLCGRRRTGDLEGKLRARGLDCLVAETYATNKVSHATKLLNDALTGRRPDAILFHSALSARAFAEHAASVLPQAYERTSFFAMSGRVADALPDFAKGRVTVASAPTGQALLETLASGLRSAGA